jgi:hypothetical protein
MVAMCPLLPSEAMRCAFFTDPLGPQKNGHSGPQHNGHFKPNGLAFVFSWFGAASEILAPLLMAYQPVIAAGLSGVQIGWALAMGMHAYILAMVSACVYTGHGECIRIYWPW